MSSVITFFYPTITSLINRSRKQFDIVGEGGRDLIFVLFFIALEFFTYWGTKWILKTINQDPTLIFLAPAPPLSLFLIGLMVMMFLAALVSAYDSFFQSHDLDLILAAPVQGLRFFLGRLALVTISVSWMPALLLGPVLIAFGQAYGGTWSYYLLAPLLFFPFFIIPNVVATIIAFLFARFISGARARTFFLILLFAAAGLLFQLAGLLRELLLSGNQESQLLTLVTILSRGEVLWLPSYWTARSVEALLLPGELQDPPFWLLSVFASLFLLSTASLLYECFYHRAFDNVRSQKINGAKQLGVALSRLAAWLPLRSHHLRGLVRKELLIFSREITQKIQLGMLCCLVALYIYNLPAFVASAKDASEVGIWYQRFTFLGNFSVGAFITIAACTRLVFPSLSLEGRAFWILQTAPIDLATVLRVKFWYWYIPVALLSLSLFCAGAWVVGVGATVMLCYSFSSLSIAYGVVGTACGLGAAYARFDWESPSQLCAGFGSLIYMLYSCSLVTATMVPTWLMLFSTSPGFLRGSPSNADLLNVAGNVVIVCLVNIVGVRLAFRWGEKNLTRLGDAYG